MGIRGSQTGELSSRICVCLLTVCWARRTAGFKIAMTTLDGGRIGIAAQALGIAQGALDKAIAS